MIGAHYSSVSAMSKSEENGAPKSLAQKASLRESRDREKQVNGYEVPVRRNEF